MYSAKEIADFIDKEPLLQDVIALKSVVWINPNRKTKLETLDFSITKEDMLAAEALWNRFAPFFYEAFPETQKSDGILESPLKELPNMKRLLNENNSKIDGRFFLKCDNKLPIAGSIKARGGFYEVLHYAEKLALKAGILKDSDYRAFASPEFKKFFNNYKIGVGSTGNLGLSIGIISAALGFQVTVYMSADAKPWKKDLLRKKGVKVIEFSGDFSEAILAGRKQTKADAMAYFVDDENSKELFLGYSVGALRLAKQLELENIQVDAQHPLFVYSPCGVGGSPGGVAFGLKQIYGNHVHCFFVEPTHSPAVLTGLLTGKKSRISVQDIGIDNKTEADGLAVGRPSSFATSMSSHLISGLYTIEDSKLFQMLSQLMDTEQIFLEPSATAGLIGPQRVLETNYAVRNNLNMKNATHIVWATGGDLVPEKERLVYYNRGLAVLN
ncbi:D-serine ammonia-lyase [Xanthomarina sp. F2636L]|uniref:D-serine ammonia-lyase n=1 Tax=Xanthomarina sp. F2636L TaxID=2996018 RepID=UPI00225E4501|nr:D-serine ammonia-lyase [Xanthomarina sp. F2636L]MCX7550966.1 D-serine ammonia-lyase [Xanthomarina sp. F2636L]